MSTSRPLRPSRPRPSQAALHPLGTVRAAIEGAGGERSLFRALTGSAARLDLGADALVFAEQLLTAETFLDDGQREHVGYLVLALLAVLEQGATCLSLEGKGPLRDVVTTLNKALGRRVNADALITTARELARGHFATIIGSPGQRRPLIVDGGLLYMHRDYQHECRVASAVRARLRTPAPTLVSAIAGPSAAAGLALTAEQGAAVDTALAHHLAVIVGGPGTGKTAIAMAIVQRLQAAGVRDIALAAPTGRAANRLGESVARGHAGPEPAPAAMTLHRLLGARGGSFRHDARSPLPYGAVLVDEASMIDARLLDALLTALPTTARLILLGDADQLPSVEAGQALADLVAHLPSPGPVAHLTTSFRMLPSDPDGAHVLAAAQAIRDGDVEALLTGKARRLRLEDVDASDAPRGARLQACEPGTLSVVLDAWFARHTSDDFWRAATRDHRFDPDASTFAPESAAALTALLGGFARSRILAATHGQVTGTVAISAYLHARLVGASGRTDAGAEFVPGEPVVMTANDHARGLYNGDVGVIARVLDGDGEVGAGHGRWRVVFARGGVLVPLPIEVLRDRLERAWAVTVHKSQGSEADDVTLVLPADDSPLLTRELLYTAVTRARRGVRIVGRRAVLQAAVARRAVRTTGLGQRLREPEPEPT